MRDRVRYLADIHYDAARFGLRIPAQFSSANVLRECQWLMTPGPVLRDPEAFAKDARFNKNPYLLHERLWKDDVARKPTAVAKPTLTASASTSKAKTATKATTTTTTTNVYKSTTPAKQATSSKKKL